MNINDILIASKGKLYNKINLYDKYREIKIDSRKIDKDDIFICIKGNNFDGHDFIYDVLDKAKLIISTKKLDISTPYILVDDTIQTLSDISKYILNKYNPFVIGITGSMGKTTTRDLLYNILKTKYKVQTNEGNYNNHIGIPLTIFKLKEETEILILEMGMNHYYEIEKLSKLVNPDIGVITNIGSSHIGNFKSRENIFKAKLEILDGMRNKILFVNGDNEYLKNILIENIHKSGFNKDNDLIGYDLKTNLYLSSFKIKYNGSKYKIKTNLPKHLLNNVLNVINISLYLNVDIQTIINVLKNYKPFKNRMNILKDKNNNTIINDCYNNSFESLTGILEVLQNEKQKKLLILGDIKELGIKSKELHNKIITYLDKINDKEIILVGKEMKSVRTNAIYFNNYKEVINYLKDKKIKDTLILIKASHSLEFNYIVDYFVN